MNIMLTSVAYLFAAFAIGVMGFAIQRGGTCTVAAVDEIVSKRRFRRLASIFGASLWVLGGLLIAQSLDWLGPMPGGYAPSHFTVLGGALLGLGAYVNRACVFGAIARLGSGEWAYAVTPLGFYAGCVSVGVVFSFAAPPKLPRGSPVLGASAWIAIAFAALLLGRLGWLLFAKRAGEAARGWRERLAQRVWSPHAATTVIGITFLIALLLVGALAYTDVLAELARGMAANLLARVVLLASLFAGALAGGWTAGRFRNTRISLPQLAKCFVGGVLMGWGSLLIPGSNDGLILLGMPLLWPYAWLAFLSMCAAIGLALLSEKALGRYAARAGVE